MKLSVALASILLGATLNVQALQVKVDSSDRLVLIAADGSEIKRITPGTVALPVDADGQKLRISFGSDIGQTLVAVLAPETHGATAFEAKVVPSENGWSLRSIESGLTGKLLVDGTALDAGKQLSATAESACLLKSDGKSTATVSWVKGKELISQGSKADNKEIAKVEVDPKQVAPVVEGEPGVNVGVPPVYINAVADPASSTYTSEDTFDRTFLLTGERKVIKREVKKDGGDDDRPDTTGIQPTTL